MRVWTVFDAMFKNSRIEAGTNKNIPCMESYADFEIVVGANRIALSRDEMIVFLNAKGERRRRIVGSCSWTFRL